MSSVQNAHIRTLWGAGYSLIPVNRDKTPVLAWKTYQYNRASQKQIASWCLSGHQLAIVTGQISNLYILDIDDPALFETFTARHPRLSRTLTVKTRRGYHLYFRLKRHHIFDTTNMHPLYICSGKAPGVDFLAEGCYAVAPGATINQHTYKLLPGYPKIPLKLKATELRRIQWFVRNLCAVAENDPLGFIIKDPEPEADTSDTEPVNYRYQGWYRQRSPIGRNNALYRVAREMHDIGYTREHITETLTDLHVTTPAPKEHAPESATARRREALATIASATRHKRRIEYDTEQIQHRQLPNPVREALHRQKMTAVAQVLDTLRMLKNYQPGRVTYGAEVRRVLHGCGISKHIIEKACRWLLTYCRSYQKNPHKTAKNNVSCLGGQNRENKNAVKYFKLPSNFKLCRLLNIDPDHTGVTGSDYLSEADRKSPSKYRKAHLRAFIKRKPGKYTNRYLRYKTGVSERTIRRYKAKTGIKSIPQYAETPILSYKDFAHIPDDPKIFPQFFLQDASGKRYPALRVIAAALKREKKRFKLMRQLASYLYIPLKPNVPIQWAAEQ